jgi:hypothetical protein
LKSSGLRITSDGDIVFRDFGQNVGYILEKRGRFVTTFADGGKSVACYEIEMPGAP